MEMLRWMRRAATGRAPFAGLYTTRKPAVQATYKEMFMSLSPSDCYSIAQAGMSPSLGLGAVAQTAFHHGVTTSPTLSFRAERAARSSSAGAASSAGTPLGWQATLRTDCGMRLRLQAR